MLNMSTGTVCGSKNLRNTVDILNKLRGCRVIEGHLIISLIERHDEMDYDDMVFPELTEVTDYVLLYRVNGLKSVGKLFPNLRVIRGNRLLHSYSFVVSEMMHLEVNSSQKNCRNYFIYKIVTFFIGNWSKIIVENRSRCSANRKKSDIVFR